MSFMPLEVAAQEATAAKHLFAERNRHRIGAIAASYALFLLAGLAAASVTADTILAAYGLIGSGVFGGLLVALLFHFQAGIRAANRSLDQSLDTLSFARAAAQDQRLSDDQTRALSNLFHTVQANRFRDFFGRQQSRLYLSQEDNRRHGLGGAK